MKNLLIGLIALGSISSFADLADSKKILEHSITGLKGQKYKIENPGTYFGQWLPLNLVCKDIGIISGQLKSLLLMDMHSYKYLGSLENFLLVSETNLELSNTQLCGSYSKHNTDWFLKYDKARAIKDLDSAIKKLEQVKLN